MPTHESILVFSGAAIIAIASFLLVGVLSALGPATLLAWSTIYCLPLLIATGATYAAAGAGPAATLLISGALASLMLCGGWAIIARGKTPSLDQPSATMSLILPIGIILLLAGFAVSLTTATLIGLAIVGLLALDIARNELHDPADSPGRLRPFVLFAAIPPAAIIALAIWYLRKSPEDLAFFSPARADARLVCVITPALIAPLLANSMRAGRSLSIAFGTAATVAIIALTIGLPLLVASDYYVRHTPDDITASIGLPPITWRLDVPLLVAGGFALIGLRTGLIVLRPWTGLLLASAYGIYLVLAALIRTMP